MRKNYRYNKSKDNNIKKARIIILFMTIVFLIVGGRSLIAAKFSKNRQEVQALDDTKQSGDSDSNSNDKKDNRDSLNVESNSEVEDSSFIEKYFESANEGAKARWSRR